MQSAEPQSNIRTVPVSLNGVTRFMVLDTGGAVTQLSRDTIEELKLPVRASSAAAYDITGRVSRHFATVKDFSFGDLHRTDAAFLVWPASTRRGISSLGSMSSSGSRSSPARDLKSHW